MSRTNLISDFDENLEKVLNTNFSEEDILAEYIYEEKIKVESEEYYKKLGIYQTSGFYTIILHFFLDINKINYYNI
jgi:hypothetical protein